MNRCCGQCGEIFPEEFEFCPVCGMPVLPEAPVSDDGEEWLEYEEDGESWSPEDLRGMEEEGEPPFPVQPPRSLSFGRGLFFLVVLAVLGFSGYNLYDALKVTPLEAAARSVVLIETYDEEGNHLGQGSGVCVLEDGLVATNFHVIDGAARISLRTVGEGSYDVTEVVIFDKVHDLVLLQGETRLPALRLGDPSALEGGGLVEGISSPRGDFNQTVGGSFVDFDGTGLELRLAIQPGSSGGAVLDGRGRVVGIFAGILEDGNAYAIGSGLLEGLYKAFREGRYGTVGYGVGISGFLPDLFDDRDGSELEIRDRWTLDGWSVYRPDSLGVFFSLTDDESMLENILLGVPRPIGVNFLEAGEGERKEIVKNYNGLRSYDAWWFGPENGDFDSTEDKRVDSPLEWDRCQYLLDLGLMSRLELAVFLAELDSLSGQQVPGDNAAFNNLRIARGEKIAGLLLFGAYRPGGFSVVDNEAVKALLASRIPASFSEAERRSLYGRLGYSY